MKGKHGEESKMEKLFHLPSPLQKKTHHGNSEI